VRKFDGGDLKCGVYAEVRRNLGLGFFYRCLRGIAPPYLANDFRRVADLGTRRRLRSASTPALVVPPSRLSTVGDRAFPVAAARVWNSLPDFVTASTSLPMFKRHLKTVLFAKSN